MPRPATGWCSSPASTSTGWAGIARSNELSAAFTDWPADAEFPGVALAALAELGQE